MSDLADLERRVAVLEDIEAIKRLKARYCAFCDDDYDADGIASLFCEDGVWDGGELFGRVEGRERIRRHFSRAEQVIPLARHQVMNPLIEVDSPAGTATGQWYLFQPATIADGDRAVWLAATYHDRYRRVDDEWLVAEMVVEPAFYTPYDQGWARQRFLS